MATLIPIKSTAFFSVRAFFFPDNVNTFIPFLEIHFLPTASSSSFATSSPPLHLHLSPVRLMGAKEGSHRDKINIKLPLPTHQCFLVLTSELPVRRLRIPVIVHRGASVLYRCFQFQQQTRSRLGILDRWGGEELQWQVSNGCVGGGFKFRFFGL
ncbi:hypothetical protein L1887_13572 [Cichorium endivia]|nr:hypothetical protein L1887_13572 [Cichorium endivia]